MDVTVRGVSYGPMRQACKACGRQDKFDFHVSDDAWAYVVPAELVNRVVCLACFDEFARRKSVDYARALTTEAGFVPTAV
jgi:hypothetical protein